MIFGIITLLMTSGSTLPGKALIIASSCNIEAFRSLRSDSIISLTLFELGCLNPLIRISPGTAGSSFKTKVPNEDPAVPGEIRIRGFKQPSSKRVKDIIESDLNDLKASILQDDAIIRALPGNVDPEVINKVMIPKIIQKRYPDLTEAELEEVRQYV